MAPPYQAFKQFEDGPLVISQIKYYSNFMGTEHVKASSLESAALRTPQKSGHRATNYLPNGRSVTRPTSFTTVARNLPMLQRSLGNKATGALLSSMKNGHELFSTPVVLRSAAGEVIDKHTSWGNLDEKGLGEELAAALPDNSGIVWEVFKTIGYTNTDDVVVAISDAVPDDIILAGKLRANSALTKLFISYLQNGLTTDHEAFVIERFTRVISPDHDRLATEPWAEKDNVNSAFSSSGARMQKNRSGHGDLIMDQYSIIIDSMPKGLSPEAYLLEMASDLNAAVNSEMFDKINIFNRQKNLENPGNPQEGDIYSIDIAGPDNGSVMLVESAPDHFIFQTVWTKKDGYHPEYGSRQFGFRRLQGGGVEWYTKGASRPGYTPGSGTVGRHAQESGWTNMIQGIAKELKNRGGRVRAGSFESWTTHRDDLLSSGRITL